MSRSSRRGSRRLAAAALAIIASMFLASYGASAREIVAVITTDDLAGDHGDTAFKQRHTPRLVQARVVK
ncbi:hypothetical protein ACIGKR_30120 [Rhodococcus qingshengii]|uniref:hypothetical protein n=1 Tax=Rhodococcus qingshengii TaxID=334542 RepID=UPI0037C78535